MIDGLDQGFKDVSGLPYDIKVTRSYYQPKDKWFGQYNNPREMVGKVVTEKGFSSCSAREQTIYRENQTVLHFNIQKDSKALMMDLVNQDNFRGRETTSVSEIIAREDLSHKLRPRVHAGFTVLASKTIKTKPQKGKVKHVNQYTQICDYIGNRSLTWGTGLLNRVQVSEPSLLCSPSSRP